MKLSKFVAGSAMALVAALCAGAAQASTTLLSVPTIQEYGSPGSVSFSFDAGAGAASTSFRLNGYGSIDGNTYWSDVFTLSLNGTAIYSGTFDMGGGSPGADLVFFSDPGATTSATTTFGYFAGGYTDISTPLNLVNGSNTLTFAYDSPGHDPVADTWHAGPQGFDDERWNLGDLTVNGAAYIAPPTGVGGVPEPATWGLMIVGFAGIGGALRSRRRTLVAA
jgi:hypothetical protein